MWLALSVPRQVLLRIAALPGAWGLTGGYRPRSRLGCRPSSPRARRTSPASLEAPVGGSAT